MYGREIPPELGCDAGIVLSHPSFARMGHPGGESGTVLLVWMHGKSLAHAVVMGYQGMRHFVAGGEMIGVAVMVVIGMTQLALSPAKQRVTNQSVS